MKKNLAIEKGNNRPRIGIDLKTQQNVSYVQHVQLVVPFFGLLNRMLDLLQLLMLTDLYLILEMKVQSKDLRY